MSIQNIVLPLSLRLRIAEIVSEKNNSVLAARQVPLTAAYVVARRAIALTASLDPAVEGYAAIKAVTAFTTLAMDGRTSLTASANLGLYTDVLPVGHPEFSNADMLPIKTLRTARAEWLAADPRIADEYRPLVASAFGATPGSLEQRHARARLDRVDSHSVPLDIVLTPLLAAARKIDIAALKARVADQLRDPHTGQWIEEGHFAMFDLKGIGGKIRKVFGQLVGGNDMLGYGEIHVTDDPDLGTGVVKVNKANITAVGGVLTDEALGKAGIDTQGKQRVYLNTDAQTVNDLAKTMDVAPSDWTWDQNEDNADGSKGAFISSDGFKAVPVGTEGQTAKTFNIFDADDKPIDTLQGEGWGNIQGGLQKIRQDMAKKADTGEPLTEGAADGKPTWKKVRVDELKEGDKIDVAGVEHTISYVSPMPYKYKVKSTDLKQTKSGYRKVMDIELTNDKGESVVKRWNPATEVYAGVVEKQSAAPKNLSQQSDEAGKTPIEPSVAPAAAPFRWPSKRNPEKRTFWNPTENKFVGSKEETGKSSSTYTHPLYQLPGKAATRVREALQQKITKLKGMDQNDPNVQSELARATRALPIWREQELRSLNGILSEITMDDIDAGIEALSDYAKPGEDSEKNAEKNSSALAKVQQAVGKEVTGTTYTDSSADPLRYPGWKGMNAEQATVNQLATIRDLLNKKDISPAEREDILRNPPRQIGDASSIIDRLLKLPFLKGKDITPGTDPLNKHSDPFLERVKMLVAPFDKDFKLRDAIDFGGATKQDIMDLFNDPDNALGQVSSLLSYMNSEQFATLKDDITKAATSMGVGLPGSPSPDAAAEGKVKAKNKAEAKGKMAEPATDAQKNYVKAMLKNPAVPDEVRSRIQADLDEQGDAINKNDIGLHIAELKNYPSKSLPTDKMYNSIQRELYARGASAEEIDKILADLPNMDKKQASDLIGSLKERPDLAGEEATKNGFEETTNESDKYDGQRRWTKVEAGKQTTVLLNGDGWSVNHQSNVDPTTGTWNDSQTESVDHSSEESSAADSVFKKAADTHETLGAKEELPIDESAVAADVAAEVKELSEKQKEPATDKQRAFVDSLLANPKVPADVKSDIESQLAAKPDMNKAEIGEIIGALKKFPGSDAPTSKMLNSVKRELIARGVPVDEANETRANLDGMSKSEVSDLISKLKSKDDAAGAQAAASGFVEATSTEDQASGVRRFNLLGSDDELLAALTLDGEGFTLQRKDENGEDDELFLGRNLGSFERTANAAKAAQDLKNTDVTKTPGFDSESDREKKIALATYNKPGGSGTWMEGKTPDGQRGWSYYDVDGNVTEVTENPDGSFTRRSSDAPEPVTFDNVDEAFSLDGKPSASSTSSASSAREAADKAFNWANTPDLEPLEKLGDSMEVDSRVDTILELKSQYEKDMSDESKNDPETAANAIDKLADAYDSLAQAIDANYGYGEETEDILDSLSNHVGSLQRAAEELRKTIAGKQGGDNEKPAGNKMSDFQDDFDDIIEAVQGIDTSGDDESSDDTPASDLKTYVSNQVSQAEELIKKGDLLSAQSSLALAAADANGSDIPGADELGDALNNAAKTIADIREAQKALGQGGGGGDEPPSASTPSSADDDSGEPASDRIFGKAGISDDRIMQAMEDVDDWVASEKGNAVSEWGNKVGNLDQMISSFNDEPEARMQKTSEALYELGRELDDNGYKDSANTLFDMSKALSDEFYGDSDEDEDATSTPTATEYTPAPDWTPAENGFNFTGGDEPGEGLAAFPGKKKKVRDLIQDGDYGTALDELFAGAASIPMSRAIEDDISGSYDGIPEDGDVFYQNADTIVYKTKDGRWRVYSADEMDGFIDTGEPATDKLADELLKEMMAPKNDSTQARFYDPRLNDLFHGKDLEDDEIPEAIEEVYSPAEKAAMNKKIGDSVTVIGKKGKEKPGKIIGFVPDSIGRYIVEHEDGSTSLPWYFELKPEGGETPSAGGEGGSGAREAADKAFNWANTPDLEPLEKLGDSMEVDSRVDTILELKSQYEKDMSDESKNDPETAANAIDKLADAYDSLAQAIDANYGYGEETEDILDSLSNHVGSLQRAAEELRQGGKPSAEKPSSGGKIGDRIVVTDKKGKEKSGEITGYVPGSIGQYMVKYDDGTTGLPWYYDTKPEGGETNLGSSGRSSEQVARDAENAKKTANELAAEWNSNPFPIADPDSLASEESLTKMRNILLDGATNSDYFGPALKAIDDPNLSGAEKLQRIADALTERGFGSDGKGVDLPNANPGLPLNGEYSGREKALWAMSNIKRALNLSGIFSTKEKEAGKDKLNARLQKIVDDELKKRNEGDEGNEGTGGVDPKVPSPSKPGGGGAEASTSENSSPELTSKVEGTKAQLTKRFASREERDAWLRSIPKGAEAGIGVSISSPTDFDLYNNKREHYEVKIELDTRTEGLGVPKGQGASRKKAIEWAEKEGFDLSDGEHSSDSVVPKVNVGDKITMTNIRFDDKIDQAEKIEAKLKPGEEKDSARLRIKSARDKISKARKARLDGDLEESEKLTEEAAAELQAMAEAIEKYMVSPKSQEAKYGLKNKEIREDVLKLAKAVEAVTTNSRIAFAKEKQAKTAESSAPSSGAISGDTYKKLIDDAYSKYDPGVSQHSWDSKGIGESIMSHLGEIADDIKSGKDLDAKDAAKKMRQLADMYNELVDAVTDSEGEDGAEWSTDDSSIQDLIEGAKELEKQADLLDPKAVDSPKVEAAPADQVKIKYKIGNFNGFVVLVDEKTGEGVGVLQWEHFGSEPGKVENLFIEPEYRGDPTLALRMFKLAQKVSKENGITPPGTSSQMTETGWKVAKALGLTKGLKPTSWKDFLEKNPKGAVVEKGDVIVFPDDDYNKPVIPISDLIDDSEPKPEDKKSPISVDAVIAKGSIASKIVENADMDAADLEKLDAKVAEQLKENPQLAAVLKFGGEDNPIFKSLLELDFSDGASSIGLEGDLYLLRDTLDATVGDSDLTDALTRLLKSVEKKNNTKDLSGFKKISEAKGSNPGGIYEDPATGERFYVKFPKSTLHGENETLASAIYEELGISSVKVERGELDGKPVTYTKMIDGAKGDLKDKLSDKFYMKQLQEGFAVDALLANWDVAGLEYDNVVSDADGLPVRVDPGGALLFRAQGTPKTDDQFNENVPELDTFTDKNSTRPAAKVFSSMTAGEKMDSALKLGDLDDEIIDKLVNENISDEAAADKLKKLLKARRDNILSKLVSSKAFEDEVTKQGETSEPDEEFPPYAYGEKKSHSEGDRVDVLWDPKNDVEMTGEVVSGPDADQMYKIRLDDSKANGEQAGNVITANVVSLRPEQEKPNFDDDAKPAVAPEVKTSTGELKPGDKVVYKDGSTGTIVKADKNPKYVHVAMDSKNGKLQIKALSKLTKAEGSSDEKTEPAVSPSGKKIVPKPTAETTTKKSKETEPEADAAATGFTNFKDANGVTWSSSMTQNSNGDSIIKWDGTNGETFPVYLQFDSFVSTWKVMKTDWAGHPFLVKDTWDSDSTGALNFVANEIKGGYGATEDLGDAPSIVPLKPVGNDMLAFNDGNGTSYPELPSVVLLKDPDSSDANPKYWIQIEPPADQAWSGFEDHMSSPATRSLAEAISIVNAKLKNNGVTKETVDSQVGDKETIKWDVYGAGLVTNNVDTKAYAETGLMSPVDPTKPMFRVKETEDGSLDLVIVPPANSGLDTTAITTPDSEALDVAVSEALAADYKQASNFTPNENEINWIQALGGVHLPDSSKWTAQEAVDKLNFSADITKSGLGGEGYVVDSKNRPIGKGELVVLSDGRTGVLVHVGLPDGVKDVDTPQPKGTIIFADGSTEAIDSDKIRGLGRILPLSSYNASSTLTGIKRRHALLNMEKTGVELTPEKKAAAASQPFFTGRIVKDAKGQEGFIVEDKGDGYYKVQFGDGYVKSRAGSKLTLTDKQVEDYNTLMYVANHIRKGNMSPLKTYGQTGGEGLATPVKLSAPGQKVTASGVAYGNVKVTKNALGASQVVVDNPLPPTESSFANVPSLATAMETTLNPDDPQAALRGASAAWDSDSVEDLDIRLMRAINQNGEDSLSAKFKLTAWAGDTFINDLMRRAAEGDQSVTITDSLYVPKQVINSNGVLSYDPADLSAAGVMPGATAYSSSEGTTATVTLDDGTKIIFMRSDAATKAKGEGVNLAKGTNAIAFHNKALVLFPEGAKNDPDAIAKTLALAGVRDSRPATEADAKILIENRLISIFAGKTDPKTNPGGASREKLLEDVKAKYDIGPEDVTMSTGGGGRVEMRLSEDKAKALAKKTNIAQFKHTWSSTGQIPQEAGESDDDFRDRVADVVAAKLTTPQGGLLSTSTRWTEGIPTSGMSSATDVKTGGGDYVFLTPEGSYKGKSYSYYNGAPTIYFSPEKLFRRLDFWANSGDKYGARPEGKTAMQDMVPGSYEAIFKQRVSFEDLDSLVVRTQEHKDALIKALKKRGVYDFGGVPIEQIIQVG